MKSTHNTMIYVETQFGEKPPITFLEVYPIKGYNTLLDVTLLDPRCSFIKLCHATKLSLLSLGTSLLDILIFPTSSTFKPKPKDDSSTNY